MTIDGGTGKTRKCLPDYMYPRSSTFRPLFEIFSSSIDMYCDMYCTVKWYIPTRNFIHSCEPSVRLGCRSKSHSHPPGDRQWQTRQTRPPQITRSGQSIYANFSGCRQRCGFNLHTLVFFGGLFFPEAVAGLLSGFLSRTGRVCVC